MKSIDAALLFISITIPMLFSPLAGNLIDRVGSKYPATIAFAFAVPNLVLLRFVTEPGLSQVLLLVFLLFLFGCSFALAMPALMSEVTHSVEEVENKRPGVFGEGGAFAQAYGTSSTFVVPCHIPRRIGTYDKVQ